MSDITDDRAEAEFFDNEELLLADVDDGMGPGAVFAGGIAYAFSGSNEGDGGVCVGWSEEFDWHLRDLRPGWSSIEPLNLLMGDFGDGAPLDRAGLWVWLGTYDPGDHYGRWPERWEGSWRRASCAEAERIAEGKNPFEEVAPCKR